MKIIRCAAGLLRQRYQHIYGEMSTSARGPVRCSLLTVRHRRRAYRQSDGGLISMVDAKELPADSRSTHWTVAEVLAAVGQAGDGATAIAHTVSNWATPPNFRITGGTGPTYPSFTVRADTRRATGKRPRGVLTLYADSHGSGAALEVRVNEMCNMPPYDRLQARERLTADLHALGIPRLDREDVLCHKRPEIPLAELTHGRVERLLALLNRWIDEVRAHHPG